MMCVGPEFCLGLGVDSCLLVSRWWMLGDLLVEAFEDVQHCAATLLAAREVGRQLVEGGREFDDG